MKIPLFLAFLGFLSSADSLLAQTTIRDEFGGKRILYVDGQNIRPDPSGNRLLFVDGDNIRPDPTGKRLLFIDHDGDIRPEPGGVRIAFWDKTELRKKPAGFRMGLLDDHTFRPEPGFKHFFYIDGPALSRAQLTAVLYILKPEFFQLTAEEKDAQEKEMAKNGADEDAKRGADQFPGDHMIITHYTESGAGKRRGSVLGLFL